MSIESVMPSNHLILCCPLLLLSSIFSSIRVFSNVMSQLFTSGGQSIGASASVIPINIQDWFPLGWTGLISFQSKGLSRVFSNTTVQKHQFFSAQPSLWSNSHTHTWLLEKPTIVGKVVSLLFNIPSRVVIAFLPRSKCPLISWLQSPSAVILEPKKIVCHCLHRFFIYSPWSDGTRCCDPSFSNVEIYPSRNIHNNIFKLFTELKSWTNGGR